MYVGGSENEHSPHLTYDQCCCCLSQVLLCKLSFKLFHTGLCTPKFTPNLFIRSATPKCFFLAINNFVYIAPMFNRAGRNNYDDVFCFKITAAEAEIQVCACIAHLYYRSVSGEKYEYKCLFSMSGRHWNAIIVIPFKTNIDVRGSTGLGILSWTYQVCLLLTLIKI